MSKVVIIACDHLLVSKMPKKRRKNEENRLFFPKPGFRQSWLKVLGTVLQYSYFSEICWFPHKTVHPFLPPSTLYKVETLKKNSGYTRPTLFVGWGEGLDLCESEMQRCPKTFVHECSFYNNATINRFCLVMNELILSSKSGIQCVFHFF